MNINIIRFLPLFLILIIFNGEANTNTCDYESTSNVSKKFYELFSHGKYDAAATLASKYYRDCRNSISYADENKSNFNKFYSLASDLMVADLKSDRLNSCKSIGSDVLDGWMNMITVYIPEKTKLAITKNLKNCEAADMKDYQKLTQSCSIEGYQDYYAVSRQWLDEKNNLVKCLKYVSGKFNDKLQMESGSDSIVDWNYVEVVYAVDDKGQKFTTQRLFLSSNSCTEGDLYVHKTKDIFRYMGSFGLCYSGTAGGTVDLLFEIKFPFKAAVIERNSRSLR